MIMCMPPPPALSHTQHSDVEVLELLCQLRINLLTRREVHSNHHHLHIILGLCECEMVWV